MKTAILAAALLLPACSQFDVIRAGAPPHRGPDDAYTAELPAGWVAAHGKSAMLWMTRDGPLLEQMVIFQRPHAKAFPLTKQKAGKTLLPHELAELQAAEFKRESETLATATVEDLSPVLVSGRPGYRLQLAWINDEGLPMARLAYGVQDEAHYYLLGFEAPALYYFDKHKGAFEAMVASFRLKEEK